MIYFYFLASNPTQTPHPVRIPPPPPKILQQEKEGPGRGKRVILI